MGNRSYGQSGVNHEIVRLLNACAEHGVESVVSDVIACPELMTALAVACKRVGLIAAAQYLDYLILPYD